MNRSGPSPGPGGPIEGFGSSKALAASVVSRRFVPGAGATHASGSLARRSDPVREALAAAGIPELYSHQEEALQALARGENVLTVTPTASGKSLSYIIPTLEALGSDPGAKALFLFPYKALGQDQLASLRRLLAASGLPGPPQAAIYDGDTPDRERAKLRSSPPAVLISNPDMLHMGLLPWHDAWRPFFASLRLVVVDELHVYRGIFGTHMHHVMRRLARICASHGSSPRIVASSATIGNPSEFADALLGGPFHVVESSGAPRQGRHFVLLNPASGSPYTLAAAAIIECCRAGLKTIAFTKARRITELLTSWVAATAPDLAGRIASYRAGYLPSERRAIEERLAGGRLAGVITTSALEHGIDIGGLDACVLVGYPGSIMSLWQRAGRAGRSGRESLVVLIAMPDALDQYFMTNPDRLFDLGVERAVADPRNPLIASRHLVCAGSEIPLTRADSRFYPAETLALIEPLVRDGALVEDAAGESWLSLKRHPQRDVSLRSAGAAYAIVDAESGRSIGTVDGVRAFAECHAGAIYLHQARQHEVVELDIERRRVQVRAADVDYFTQVVSSKETEILEVLATRPAAGFRVSLGRLRVTQQFPEYVRRRIADQQKMSTHPLELPPVVFETVGLWWEVPDRIRREIDAGALHYMGSLHASEHAAISLFPLMAICDRGDIGGISYPAHPQIGGSAVFIYDGYPGGIGLAERGYHGIEELLGRTLERIGACPCESGCPSCVQSPKCGNGNYPLDKEGARRMLSSLLAAGDAPPERPLPPPSPAPAARTPSPPAERILYFDLETQRSAEEVGGWSRIDAMGLALAVVYDEREAAFRTYFEKDVDRLIVDLMSAGLVVGYNVKRFDYTVLRGYRDAAFDRIPTCDMLEEIHRRLGFRLKLGDLAEATLGEGKSADGLASLKWFREGRLDLVEAYCRRDVEVTRRLHLHGREKGHLLYRDRQGRPVRLPVSW